MTGLGGPREGNCLAYSFVVVRDDEGGLEARDGKDLGVMPWADLLAMVAEQGGIRPTYDLFDIAQADGTVLRIRAMDEGVQP
jgi:hypothetical protein